MFLWLGSHHLQSYQVIHHSMMLWYEVQNYPLLLLIQSQEIKSIRDTTNYYGQPLLKSHKKFLCKWNLKLNILQAVLLPFWDVTSTFHARLVSWNMEENSSTGPSVSISLLHLEDILSWCILVYGKQHLSKQLINSSLHWN